MSEWWTYRPEDFLMFSPRVYWRLFERINAEAWPLASVMLAFGVATLVLMLRRPPVRGYVILYPLGVIWMLVGWSFVWQRFAAINWAMNYVAPLFTVQMLLMLLGGNFIWDFRTALSFRDGKDRLPGVALLAVAIFLYPLLSPLQGRPWFGGEIFGIAPDPTAVATLGVLLAARGKLVPWLYPIPLAWCLLSAATLAVMDEPQAMAPLGAAVITIGTLIARWAASRRTFPV